MARSRNNGNDGENNARIKVVFFEAENVNSDLTGVINAFANAIRTAPIQVTPNSPPPPQIEGGRAVSANGDGQRIDDNEEEVIDAAEPIPVRKRQPREKKPVFQGKPDDTINWDGNGSPFVAYLKEKNPQGTMKKYLVIAAWFKRHGGKDSIDTNIMYNAYRTLGSQALSDVAQPFQDGVKPRNGYFSTVKGSGEYAITSIGLQRVDEMGGEKASDAKMEASN